MKRVFILLCLLCGISLSQALGVVPDDKHEAASEMDIYLCIGQSNMVDVEN